MKIIVFAAVFLCSCGLFGSSGSVWPAVAKCAPAQQNVIDAVTQVLLGGGDYEAGLEQLGEQYGVNVVVCVVNSLISGWKTGKLPPDVVQANARGKAFLAHVGTRIEK